MEGTYNTEWINATASGRQKERIKSVLGSSFPLDSNNESIKSFYCLPQPAKVIVSYRSLIEYTKTDFHLLL